MTPPPPIHWLTSAAIEAALCNMSGETVQICGQWTVERLVAGGGSALGIWRVAGSMSTSRGKRYWSLVLKGWDTTCETGSPSAFNWILREPELYRSGVLRGLHGVSAPAYYGSVESDEGTWIWLEDLTKCGQPEWTIDEYATAARMLGRFNGTYLSGKKMPDHRSLSQNWLAGQVAAAVPTMQTLDDFLQHPVVGKIFPPHVADGIKRIWGMRESILAELEALPQTFCHLDAFHRNIFFRSRNGEDEVILIDWSYAGRAAIGEELAALCVAGATINPKMPDNFNEIEQAALASYIDGLHETGWRGEEEGVWHAYRSAALLRYGPAILHHSLPVFMSEEGRAELSASFRIPIENLQDHLAQVFSWIASHAEEI